MRLTGMTAEEKKARRREQKRKWAQKNQTPERKEYRRNWHRLRRYGTTGEKELAEQGGRCKACRDPLDITAKTTHLHHDHEKGFGHCIAVLCHTCNHAEGYLKRLTPEALFLLVRMMGPRMENKILWVADMIRKKRAILEAAD